MKSQKFKAMIGIYALAMLSMSTLIMSPVMSLIVETFHDQGISKIQMVLSVAQLTGIFAAFLVGRLAMSVSAKKLAMIGAIGTFIFGIIPYFYHAQLWFLILCSGLVGFFMGFISNTLPSLVSESFDVEERQGVIGRQVAFTSIGTMLLLFTSGFLGSFGWHTSYLTYGFVAVCGLVAFICLPDYSSQSATAPVISIKDVLNYKILVLSLFGFFFMIVNNAYNNNISLFVAERGLGDSSVAGLISMIGQLGGLISGFAIGYLAKLIKHQMMSAAFIVEGLALLLLAFGHSTPLAFLGSFLSGCGLSLFFSQAPFLITVSVVPMFIPMAMAVLSTLNSLGGFLSPTIINTLNSLFASQDAAGAMLVGAIISLLVGVICLLTNFQARILADLQKNEA